MVNNTSSSIRILEKEPNKKGDLFARLMGYLFLALGYDLARFNIHKTGREVDIEAFHRTEKRRVVAGFYLEKPWSDNELATNFDSIATLFDKEWLFSIFEALGSAGKEQLETLKNKIS